ncbi:NAD(P)H-hydrate dehydratase [Planctomycetota bacterium]|nr:NAD(P)H-hydrate dehydratase [Planctomycetota bacterium]
MGEQIKQVTRLPLLPARPMDGHKGTFGTVVVIGGSETMLGAPAICAGAALRTGAGLVKLASDLDLLKHMLVIEPSATGLRFEGSVNDRLKVLDEIDPHDGDVLAVGPGMGQGDDVKGLIERLVSGHRDVVLDADGLNALAKLGEQGRALRDEAGLGGLIMTPHPGEYARLACVMGIEYSGVDPMERIEGAGELARRYKAVVVLKGAKTVVSDGEQFYINKTGNVSMATAGSGDVLTGMIAALRGQGLSLFDAAGLGVNLHGKAGDLWADKNGYAGLKAKDLADMIPMAMQITRRKR